MRDPKRIPRVLKEIERIWKKYPDLRLCQLIINAIPPTKAVFHVEEDQLLENLREYDANMSNTKGKNSCRQR